MKKITFISFLSCMLLFLVSKIGLACDSCGLPLARVSSHNNKLKENSQKVFFDFTVEQKVWQQRSSAAAHGLHHQGFHVHNKTHEEFYHFSLGGEIKRLTLLAELPYVVRHSTEVDEHVLVGKRQRSEGFGDMQLTAIAKILKERDYFLGPVVGIKMPTGSTTEENFQKTEFEPELQPGSGSWDPMMGGAFRYDWNRFSVHGNSIYTLRTQGAQDFRFGNLWSTYAIVDYLINSNSRSMQTKIGLDSVLQNEAKQRAHGHRIGDSGGTTWLLGPQFSIQGNSHISLFGNILFPVYQNLGGVHQLVRFVWNAGVKISF